MILTNKAKADFLKENKWIEELMFHEVDEVYLNALIFEWFDKKGLYLSVKYVYNSVLEEFEYSINFKNEEHVGMWFETRREATIDGIKHADKLYNKKFG